MLRLGTLVRLNGQDALIVARTLGGTPMYDVGFADGRTVKYVAEADLTVGESDASHSGLANVNGVAQR